jgi:hypothetical protein
VAGHRLVRDDEDPALVLGAAALDAQLLRRLAAPAADQPDRDCGEDEEDDEAEPGGDERRGDDQREVDDRQPDELERLCLGAERVPQDFSSAEILRDATGSGFTPTATRIRAGRSSSTRRST